jgi:hypothetical protein
MKLKILLVFGVAYVACGLAVVCLAGPWFDERLRETEDVELYVPNLGCNPRTGERVTLVGVTRFGMPMPVVVKNGLIVSGRDGTFTLRVKPDEAKRLREGGGYGLMELFSPSRGRNWPDGKWMLP